MKTLQAQIIVEHNGQPRVVKLTEGQLESLGLYLPAICGGNITLQKQEPLKPKQ